MSKQYSREQIFEYLKGVMSELFELQEGDILISSHLNEDLGLDSIDAIDLITKLQEFVGQRLQPEEFRGVRTVSDVIDAAEVTLAKIQKNE